MVDFVPFPGMASTDNNIQYPPNEVMITGFGGTVTASGSMVIVPSTGQVGIGTANPIGPFDVNASASIRQGLNVQGAAIVNGLTSNTYGAFGQNVTINSSNASFGTTSGALVVVGGAGIGGNLYIGGGFVVAGQTTFVGNLLVAGLTSNTYVQAAGTTTTNALVSNIYGAFGQNVTVNSNNTSTLIGNGALVVRGGVGIGDNINVGGPQSTFTYSVGVGTSVGTGMTQGLPNVFVWGNVVLSNTSTTGSGLIFPDGTKLTSATLFVPSFGTPGTIQVAGAGNTITGDSSSFVWDNTNKRLGIGTSTPTNLMSVYGTDTVLFNTRPASGVRQEIVVGNVTSYGAVLGYDPSIGQSIGYLRRGDSSASAPAISWAYVSSNYRVGINAITQPQNAMDIGGAVVIGSAYAGVSPVSNSNGLSVQGAVGIGTFTPNNAGKNVLTIFAQTGGGIELSSGNPGAGGGNIQAWTGGGLKFSAYTGGVNAETYVEALRIDPNGNLTTTGAAATFGYNLDLASSLRVGGNITVNGGANYSIFSKPQVVGYTSTALFGSTSGGVFINTDNPSISSGGYYNSNWLATNNAATVLDMTNGTFTVYLANSLTIGNAFSYAQKMQIAQNGNVTLNNNLNVYGEVYAYFSDERLKDNVEIIDNALEKLSCINGVYYNANSIAAELLNEDITVRKLGFLAQQVEKVAPEVVRQAPFDTAPDGSSRSGQDYKTVQYDRLMPLLLQAIKEQQAKIQELEARITTLELDPWP